jgi:hypothetical protein
VSSPSTTDIVSRAILACRLGASKLISNHGAVVGAPVTPRVPSVAAFVTMAKPATQIADAVAVISIAAIGNTTTSEGTSECECTRGKGGTAESKGDCKSNCGLT